MLLLCNKIHLDCHVALLLAMTRSEHETYINIFLLIIPYCHCEGGYQPTAVIQANYHCAINYQSLLRSIHLGHHDPPAFAHCDGR